MRILTFSTLYPNTIQSSHGLFVEHRLLNFLRSNPDFSARVIAPVPWFPSKSTIFGRYAEYASVGYREHRNNVEVLHPRYLTVPKVGMTVAPFLLAIFCRPLLAKLISSGWDFQLIDAHYFYPDGVAAAILANWFGKPVFVTARGSDINQIADYRLPRRLIKWASGKCEKVIAVSDALRQKMIDLGVDARRIETIRNGVDLELFKRRDFESARRRLGLPLDRYVVASVGHLIELKGHHLAIKALLGLDKDAILLIVGEGKHQAQLESLARSTGVSDRVRFCGSVSQAELSWYYSAADVTVLASSREGMPNVLLESMACGTPVVSTRVGGAPEVVNSEVAGKLVTNRVPDEVAKAISALLATRRPPEAVREHAEQFSWGPVSCAQAELFDASVKKGSSK